MICRLCLNNLSEQNSVCIFNKTGECAITEVRKLIAKYLELELCSVDPVSNTICHDCYGRLEDFHKFCLLIEQKQKTLLQQQPYEFFEVKCDDDVDLSSLKEELLELEIDPVCEDRTGCLLNEQQGVLTLDVLSQPNDVLSQPKDALSKPTDVKKSSEDDSNTSTSKRKSIRTQKPKEKKQKIADIQDEFSSTDDKNTTDDLELSCDLCKEGVGNFDELSKHFKKLHDGQEAFVKCCGKRLTQTQSIIKHFKKHPTQTRFMCSICSKVLRSENNLIIHMNSRHNEEKKAIFKCPICQKELRSRKACEGHKRRHHSEKKPLINCDKCKRSFSSTMRLKRHCQIMHEAVYPYKCQACEENFVTKTEMDTHETSCKNRNVLKGNHKTRKNVPTDLICKICCKIFANSNRLRKHIDCVHENVHPYVCEQCGKKFKLKRTFEVHLLEHSGVVEPPAQCNICNKWLKNKNSLRLHLYAHDNSFNKCELCDHVAPTRSALRRHVKKVHRLEREYQCKYCDKSFKDTKSQEEHIATHTGAQLYSCPHCSKETRSSSNMYAHIKRMHREEWLKAKLARSHDPNAPKLEKE